MMSAIKSQSEPSTLDKRPKTANKDEAIKADLLAVPPLPRAEIVAKHNVKPYRVWYVARKIGIASSAGRPKVAPEKLAAIDLAFKENPAIEAGTLAAQVGVSVGTIYNRAKETGVKLTRSRLPLPMTEKLRFCLELNASMRNCEISDLTGWTKQEVGRLLKQARRMGLSVASTKENKIISK